MFDDMSTESIKQFQMLVDNVALEFVRLSGGMEALRMLFPDFVANQEFVLLQQRLQQVYSINGIPFGSAFREYSRMAQAELNKRGV
jgi:hypothetical protein